MKTFSTRPSDVRREWHVLDATGQPLGRLSTQIATFLRGKHKPIYAPHLDVGDFVIVVNAAKVRLTGKKMEQKRYYHHSGYPGGLRTREIKHEMAKRPEWVVERAVHGMLPKGPLGLHLFKHLKVYGGADHPHASQVNAPAPEAWVPGPPGSGTPYAPRVAEVAPTPEPDAPARPTRARRTSRAVRSEMAPAGETTVDPAADAPVEESQP